MGPSINDVQFFDLFFDIPTYPCPSFPIVRIKFYYMVSDFGKPTYLPKNRTSFMDVPYPGKIFCCTLPSKITQFKANAMTQDDGKVILRYYLILKIQQSGLGSSVMEIQPVLVANVIIRQILVTSFILF